MIRCVIPKRVVDFPKDKLLRIDAFRGEIKVHLSYSIKYVIFIIHLLLDQNFVHIHPKILLQCFDMLKTSYLRETPCTYIHDNNYIFQTYGRLIKTEDIFVKYDIIL
jgi:hypothetical protein